MTDPFDVLELPKRAALSSERVKEQFVGLSAKYHPDHQHSDSTEDARERFTEINHAYQQLQSPGSRLKALLQLRFPETFEIKGALPEDLLDLFSLIGSTLQDADAFLAKKSKATSALAEALLARDLIKTQESLGLAASRVNERLDAAKGRLDEIDRQLSRDQPDESCLEPASALCRELLYLEKWQAQIQSRFHALF